eukprot:m.198599 g.198599  ORF g.198599 m.198599 type:complete len:452 (+) comp14922_c0_seq22:219-1574(+)
MAEQASESEDIGVVDVLIIGGGASGLAAAKKLSSTDLSYIVLEADSRLGGRIRPLSGFADGLGLEAGANYLHGVKSELYKHARKRRFKLAPTDYDKVLLPPHHRRKGKLLETYDTSRVPFVVEMRKRLDKLWKRGEKLSDQTTRPCDKSLQAHFVEGGASDDMLAAINTVLCGDRNTSLDVPSLDAMCVAESGWEHEDDAIPVPGVSECLSYFGEHPHELNWQVIRVDDHSRAGTGDGVVVHARHTLSQKTKAFHAKSVIVTVSVQILKDGDIQFSPALPKHKLRAIQAVPSPPCAKVFIKLSHFDFPFHEPISVISCTASKLICEIWLVKHYREVHADGSSAQVIVAFVPSQWLQNLKAMKGGKPLSLMRYFTCKERGVELPRCGMCARGNTVCVCVFVAFTAFIERGQSLPCAWGALRLYHLFTHEQPNACKAVMSKVIFVAWHAFLWV